jgi:hypothetical protein
MVSTSGSSGKGLGDYSEFLSLLVQVANGLRDGFHFGLGKIDFPTLAANPGRNGVELQVVALAVNMEGRREHMQFMDLTGCCLPD